MDRSERLQKILSQWGIASRRQAEQLILEGRVRLNGVTATLGQKANPDCDQIQVDGQVLQDQRPALVYLLLHKPVGVITTCHDPQDRLTVLDLLNSRDRYSGLHPVGRLDAETTGALLLTNDGDFTQGLTHPRHHVPKTYHVCVTGHPLESALQQWRDGILLGQSPLDQDRPTLPAQVRVLEHVWNPEPATWLEVVLQEGRNRQIRRVAQKLGYPVIHLHRTQIGPIPLQGTSGEPLQPGSYRPLTSRELAALRQLIAEIPIATPVPAGV